MPEDVKTDNPFAIDKYKNVNLPDTPVVFSGNMVDSMLNNDEVPEEVVSDKWWIFHKDNVLGFSDAERKASKLLNFDIIKLDHIMTMRRNKYKFDTELEFDIMRNVFETKLDRAVGVNNNSGINERKSLISMISENRNITDNDDSLVRESFIKKLIGKKR